MLSLVLVATISTSQATDPVPKLPARLRHVINIDCSRLEGFRREYQSSKGQGASEEDFMFSWLPVQIFSRILFGDFNVKDLPSDFGLLYWSGFNGGVWLNEIVHLTKRLGIDWSWMIRSLNRPMLLFMDTKIQSRLKLIAEGSAGQKQKAARKALKSLVMSYGYNRGYLLEILKPPRPGANIPENILVCGEFLDCQYGVADQAVLAPLLMVRAKLTSPSSAEWQKIAGTIRQKLPGSIKTGRRMWHRIMSGREFPPDSYPALLEISSQFLILNEAVMLAVCQAVADKDEPQLERALAADAVFGVSMGGYVAGLGKKNPAQ